MLIDDAPVPLLQLDFLLLILKPVFFFPNARSVSKVVAEEKTNYTLIESVSDVWLSAT